MHTRVLKKELQQMKGREKEMRVCMCVCVRARIVVGLGVCLMPGCLGGEAVFLLTAAA